MWQVGIDLASDDHGLPRAASRGNIGQHIERDVGVAAQADLGQTSLGMGMIGARRHQLGKDVGVGPLQMVRDVGVVEADVVALHRAVRQPGAGLQEELIDRDVGGQAILALCRDIEWLGAGRKQAVQQRLGEAPFEIGAILWARQGEARKDRELDAAIRLGHAIQGIEEQQWFADANWHGQPDILAHAVDDGLGTAVGNLVVVLGHEGRSSDWG